MGVHALDTPLALNLFEQAIAQRRKGYVCVTGVHGVMEARRDPALRRVLNASFLTTPDGMPMVWVGRLQGLRGIRRVYGPDLMVQVMERSVAKGWTHFLYGGQEGVASQLADALRARVPGVRIVGTWTPPFRPLNDAEEAELAAAIAAIRPDILWVGLSTPKQEAFMAGHLETLDTVLMVGVGAAFDLHTGRIADAPRWVKASGLQWLHRLIQEPRRLWKRYLINNPRFVVEIMLQGLRIRRYTNLC